MSLGVDGSLSEKQRTSLMRIQLNQRHLLSLIDDVLTFAKIEAGKLTIDIQSVLVHDVVETLEPIVRPDLKKKKLDFVCAPCDSGLKVRADPEKLRQILLNFVTNAIKFTAPQGHIRVGAEQLGDSVRIWVSDTGIGIPADQIARVFEPFFQVESGSTRRYAGIGLGLAIAHDIARAMEGEILLESQIGQGSTVSVVLPSG